MGSTVPQGKHHASEALPRGLRYRVVRGRLYHRPKSGFHQFGHRPSLHSRLGFDPSVKIISNVQGGSHTCRKADVCVSVKHQTLSEVENPPFVAIDPPTVQMQFSINDGPLAGREGRLVTSRAIRGACCAS